MHFTYQDTKPSVPADIANVGSPEEMRAKLAELRGLLQEMFLRAEDAEISLHPLWVDLVRRMAELLGIDPSTVPSELRQLDRAGHAP